MKKQVKKNTKPEGVKPFQFFGYNLTPSERAKVESELRAITETAADLIFADGEWDDDLDAWTFGTDAQNDTAGKVAVVFRDFERFMSSGVWRDRVRGRK